MQRAHLSAHLDVLLGRQVSKIGAGDDLSAAALAKLKAAHELVMASSAGGGSAARQTRLAYHIGALMAREQLVAKDPAAARRLLLSVAGARVPIAKKSRFRQKGNVKLIGYKIYRGSLPSPEVDVASRAFKQRCEGFSPTQCQLPVVLNPEP